MIEILPLNEPTECNQFTDQSKDQRSTHPTSLKRKIGYCNESDDEDMPEIGRMKVDHRVV